MNGGAGSPGATLAERILRGPLPVGEVLVLGAQIAAAVEAAHERGIIHRDLKPANIKVTPDGNVKVLDFGLAKALSPDSQSDAFANAATVPASGTGAGVVLGTAAYMSPEQARGSDVDKRTDIWAFGCVLFDMLTGRSAFGASTGSDTIAAVLTRDPDWSRLPRDLPAPIRCLLRRMLVKDPHRRLHDIGDARIELEDAIAAGADPSTPTSGEHHLPPMPRRRVAQFAGGILAVAVLAGAAGWMLKPSARATDSAPVQFALPLPAGGGSEPVWRPRDGPELFFRSGNQMMAASVTLRPGLNAKPPVELFRGEFDAGSAARPAYDVSADGTRFVMVGRSPNAHPLHELRVILRWAAPFVSPGTPAAQSPAGIAR